MDDVERVKGNIRAIYRARIIASYALCRYYAELALQNFRRAQSSSEYWNNRTNTAYNTVFADTIEGKDEVGFLLAHKVEYGVYLELANDRKHEALWPTIRDLDSAFEIKLREIWADA